MLSHPLGTLSDIADLSLPGVILMLVSTGCLALLAPSWLLLALRRRSTTRSPPPASARAGQPLHLGHLSASSWRPRSAQVGCPRSVGLAGSR